MRLIHYFSWLKDFLNKDTCLLEILTYQSFLNTLLLKYFYSNICFNKFSILKATDNFEILAFNLQVDLVTIKYLLVVSSCLSKFLNLGIFFHAIKNFVEEHNRPNQSRFIWLLICFLLDIQYIWRRERLTFWTSWNRRKFDLNGPLSGYKV